MPDPSPRPDLPTICSFARVQVLTGADAPACLRLVFNDAGTYDVNTKTGGMDGSIILR